MKAFFKIPARFNLNYLDKIVDLNTLYGGENALITESYGSLPFSVIGNARPGKLLENVTISFLSEYIKKSKDLGLSFDYTMNSTNHAGQEIRDGGKDMFLKEIETLIHAGVSNITISTPYLIRLIFKNFPEIKLTASINFCTSTLIEINRFEKMGILRVVLKRDINRNFNNLKSFIKKSNIELEILLNSLCRLNCNSHQYHNCVNSYCSIKSSNKNLFLYPVYECTLEYLNDPSKFICSAWIRPEDLKHYMKLGYQNFKFDGRYGTSEENLLKIAKAYLNQNYDGDFFDFFSFSLSRKNNKKDSFSFKLRNKELDGFIVPFLKGKMDCDGCLGNNPYCKLFMRKIKFSNKKRKEYSELLEKEMDDVF